MYQVSYGEDIHEVETRAEAIVKAREISTEHRGIVSISDDKERERMTYQAGELVSYDYETRRS
jgi:hypothetical protein